MFDAAGCDMRTISLYQTSSRSAVGEVFMPSGMEYLTPFQLETKNRGYNFKYLSKFKVETDITAEYYRSWQYYQNKTM